MSGTGGSLTCVVRLACVFFVTAAAGAWAQGSTGAISSPTIEAVKATKPPLIDGGVAEDEWQAAPPVADFIQFEPQRGERSQLRTEARVLYDAGHLYVAFRAWDAEPITAQLTQRDAELLRDDAVVVVVDSTNDRRSGYYFITNALGTQADGRISDDGRNLELSFWSGPLDNQWRVSEAGRLTQLSVPAPVDRIQVVPYALAQAQDGVPPNWDAGIDARYAMTATTAIYGTLYPDFATVEADQEQINLTRFELTLPEKRQFFLEGQEQFNQRFPNRYPTFYSRRIADISAGGKLLGKQGPWTVAFISAESNPSQTEQSANFSVGRVQRDILGRSTVAVMASNRRFNNADQGAFSADTSLFFGRTFSMTAQAVKTYGPFGHGTMAFLVRPSYDSSTGHFHVRYGDIGTHVAENLNVIGQIVDDDRRELDSHVTKIVWIRKGAFEQFRYDSNYNAYWSQAGALRRWKGNQAVAFEFRNRMNTRFSWAEEMIEFEKPFRNRQVNLDVGYNTREYQSVTTGLEFGRNFDSDYLLWTGAASYKVTQALSAEYSLERLELDPDPRDQSTWIHVLRANQSFTKDLFLRLFFQTNSAIERHNVQAVFVWRYLPPFGTVQVAYQRGTAGFGERSTQGNTLFVKTTTVF